MVVVVDDFDSGFVDFGCGGRMMFDLFFFFSYVGLMAVVVAMVVVMAMVWWYGV